MKLEVRSVIGLADSGDEATLLQGWLNDGVIDVLQRTQCYVASTTITETSGSGDITLDAGILLVKSLRWSSATASIMAERTSLEEIERLRAADATSPTSGFPTAFYAVAGANLLLVWPTPAAADTITVYHVPRPTAMSADGDDPSTATFGGVPAEFHKAIVEYGKWKAADFRDDQSSAQGERYRQFYEDEIARCRNYTYLHGGRPGRARLHPSRRRYPRHNDVYPG